MRRSKMNIKELKADIQKYLNENLVVERACYDLAAERFENIVFVLFNQDIKEVFDEALVA